MSQEIVSSHSHKPKDGFKKMKKIQDCRLSKWGKEEKLCLVITSIPLGHWTCPEHSQNSQPIAHSEEQNFA